MENVSLTGGVKYFVKEQQVNIASEQLSCAAHVHTVDDDNDLVKMTTMGHPSTLCIGQCLSGSVIDLSAPDAVQAVASAMLLAKAVSIRQPVPWIDTVKENHVLAVQNHALAIIVQQMKLSEQEATHWYRELKESQDWLYLDHQRQCNVINDLEARVANNNANLISELQDNITHWKKQPRRCLGLIGDNVKRSAG
jgi:hypothetical protein